MGFENLGTEQLKPENQELVSPNSLNLGNEQLKSESKKSVSLNDFKNETESKILQIENKDLRNEAEKILKNFLSNKDVIKPDSLIISNDLKKELNKSLNALKYLEDNFGNKEGFQEFKKLFLSDKITFEQRKLIYDLIESGEFGFHIDIVLDGKMFPDIESIDTYIYESKKAGIIENSDISKLENLELSELGLNEIEYYENKIKGVLNISKEENKIKLLSKLDEINNRIIEIKNEATLLETLNPILLKQKYVFDNTIKNAVNNGKIKDNEGSIKTLLEDFDLALKNKENTDGIKNKIIEVILSGDNLKQIIAQAKEDGNEKEVHDFLVVLGNSTPNGGALLLQTLENNFPNLKNKPGSEGYSDSLIRNKEMGNYFGTESGIGRNGDKYIHGDKIIDFSENPPKGYLVNEKGYKLENDIQQMMNKKEIIQKRRELQSLKLDYFDLEKSQNKKRPRIEELSEIQEEDRTENQKIELAKLEGEFNSEQTKINELREKAKVIMDFFDHTQLFDKTKEEKRKEDENKKRETLEFIHSIGFDLIPQSISDAIIARINSQRYRGIINGGNNGFEINGNINLANGEFGEGEGGLENKNDKKVIFTKLFNLILTGDPTKPINVEIVKSNINKGSLITPNQINSILYNEESGILNGFGIKYNQLEKNFRGKKVEN